MRFEALVRRACVLVITAGVCPTTVWPTRFYIRDTRQFGGTAVITELDASGNAVRQSTGQCLSGRSIREGLEWINTCRRDSSLSMTAIATTTYTSTVGPKHFAATGFAQLETNIAFPRFTTGGSQVVVFYDITFELMQAHRYLYTSSVSRSHVEGGPSWSETRLSDGSFALNHHMELFETGGFRSLSRSGVLPPGLYGLHGNARLFDFGHDVPGNVQFSVDLDLSPVPEPATMVFVGTGLLAIASRRWRRSSRKDLNY